MTLSKLIHCKLREFKSALPDLPYESLDWLCGRVNGCKEEEIQKELRRRAALILKQTGGEAA